MTIEEATKFVTEVLQGLWSHWKPKYEELNGWIEKLKPFDYEKAQKTVRDIFFSTDLNKPPAGKIMKRLYSDFPTNFHTVNEFVSEPGKVYGKKAHEEAVANILNGPDTQGRQWLTKYLDKKYPNS